MDTQQFWHSFALIQYPHIGSIVNLQWRFLTKSNIAYWFCWQFVNEKRMFCHGSVIWWMVMRFNDLQLFIRCINFFSENEKIASMTWDQKFWHNPVVAQWDRTFWFYELFSSLNCMVTVGNIGFPKNCIFHL